MDAFALRLLFRRSLLLALATPVACSSSSTTTTVTDTGAPHDTGGGEVQNDSASADSTIDEGIDASDALPDTHFEDAACDPVLADPDAGTCEISLRYPCGLPSGYPSSGFTSSQCQALCASDGGPTAFSCSATPDDTGSGVTLQCLTCVPGRRTAGCFDRGGRRGTSSLGAWLARMAELEAAAVDAFGVMERELRAHGAPRSMLRRIARARRDERRHARTMGTIARRHGGTPRRPGLTTVKTRSLEAIAMENAREGCVRETFSAMVATWQASQAGDAQIAAKMQRIALEETHHAALSWRLSRWSEARLGAEARARVIEARRCAIAELRRDLAAAEPHADVVALAGLPDRETSLVLFDAIAPSLV